MKSSETIKQEKVALASVTVVGGVAVLVSYVAVIGNYWNSFEPLKDEDKAANYFESPFWLGLPSESAIAVTAMQALAAGGFLSYLSYKLFTAAEDDNQNLPTISTLMSVFLIASFAWPFAARWALRDPSKIKVAICALTLVIAAIAAILAVSDAFQAKRAPWYVVIGTLLFALVVALADGVGWNSRLISYAK